MSTRLAGYIITNILYQDEDVFVWRGQRTSDQIPVLIKTHTPMQTPIKLLERFSHELQLADKLNPTWAIRPIALEKSADSTTLILEDFNGYPLDKIYKNNPLPIKDFLKIALQVTSILADLHQNNIIHKDIKPQNIWINPLTGQIKLSGFGIALLLSDGYQATESPAILEGTLAYMSPEQTGRINRTIDQRSDLYSLGVTFYQLLTGNLPFHGNDPLEWAYCHIAKIPQALTEHHPEIPPILSDIVMKLLTKSSEERYQTARGLLADLEECLGQLEHTGEIVPFPIGQRDISGRFQIPQKLYGREEEIETLLQAFKEMTTTGAPELALVAGYSGIGKSALVYELYKPIVEHQGFFISGKFDQYKREIPYFTITQALQELIQQILASSETEIQRWKRLIQDAVGINGQLIIDIIPQVEFIIGKQPAVQELPLLESQHRFNMVFRQFIQVFARKDHPLVVFLDDLQWSDSSTLKLLQYLVTHPELKYLLFIGAYRDNEVDETHPLTQTIQEIQKTETALKTITLSPLRLSDVEELVAETFHCNRGTAQPFAQLLQEKTHGNPFFINQFLTSLHQQHLLKFDQHHAVWVWNIDEIQAMGFTDNIADMMLQKLWDLPDETRNMLTIAACFGIRTDIRKLALVSKKSEQLVLKDLEAAIQAGLVVKTKDTSKFLHDRIQQAAYLLLSPEQQSQLHLQIGKLLLAHLPPEEIEENLFDIIGHLNLGASHLSEQKEREETAALNLKVARKAKASMAYGSAINYLKAGLALLGPNAWKAQYNSTFTIHMEWSECEFMSSNFEKTEELLDMLLYNAQTKLEKGAVYRMKVILAMTKGEYQDALDKGLECLQLFGIELPLHPSEKQLEEELDKVRNILEERQIEDLVNLPKMTDIEMLTVMGLLAAMLTSAYYVNQGLLALLCYQMINFSIKYGNADDSTNAYSGLAIVLVSIQEKFQDAYRFGKLSIALVEKYDILRERAKAYFIFGQFINTYSHHLKEGIDYLNIGFETAHKVGDLIYACFSCTENLVLRLTKGDPLNDIYEELEQCLDYVKKAKVPEVEDVILHMQQFILNIRGLTDNFSTFNDNTFNQDTYEAFLNQHRSPLNICLYHILKLQARFLSGDYEEAIQAGQRVNDLLWGALGQVQLMEYYCYYSLALAAHYNQVKPDKQQEYLNTLIANQKQLHKWSESCPDNFFHKYAIVSAEIARIQGNTLEAMKFYDLAIQSAHENEYFQHEGIANELAGRFYLALGNETISNTYLREAWQCYTRWNANGKIKQLEQEFPQIRDTVSTLAPAVLNLSTEQLDLLSVIKASQAISKEISLEKLIDTLMRIVMENTGSHKGALLLSKAGEVELRAIAILKEDTLKVSQLAQPLSGSSLPESVINYVRRTHESTVLNNTRSKNPFSTDPYILSKNPKSMLCKPILKQDELIGILYLENDQVYNAFTPDTITALEILAAQTAISLENTVLYSERKQTEKHLKKTLDRERLVRRTIEISSHSFDTEAILDSTTQEIGRFFNTDRCFIVLYDDQSQNNSEIHNKAPLKLFNHYYQTKDLPPLDEEDTPFHALQLLTGDCSGECSPAVLVDIPNPSNFPRLYTRYAEKYQIRSVLALKIVYRNVCYGRLILHQCKRNRYWKPEELKLLETIVSHVGNALYQAELFQHEQQAKNLAETANQKKSQFLASISHELRTPLTAIIGYSEMMGQGMGGELSDKQKRYLHNIVTSGKHLLDIVNDLLDFTKAGSNKIKLEPQWIQLEPFIQEIHELVAKQAERKKVSLTFNVQPRLEGITADPVRLKQIFLNLLSNAIKFNKESGYVIVRLFEDKAWLVCEIADSGIGIPKEKISELFTEFYQIDNSLARRFEGTGLGLALTKKLIELQGGTISVESIDGVGSTFTFKLPISQENKARR